MGEPKRYDEKTSEVCTYMVETHDGRFVRHLDWVATNAEFQKASVALRKATEEVRRLKVVVEAGRALAQSHSHDLKCRFTGCSCGAVELHKVNLLEFWREYRAFTRGGDQVSGEKA